MARKARKFENQVSPDPKFNSVAVSKFINHIMLDGKKSVAYGIFYSAIENLKKVAHEKKVHEIDLFFTALENLKPRVKMKSRRVGGATYQVPMPLREKESEMMAMRWLIESTRAAKGKSASQALYEVIVDTVENRGNAIKRKEEMHRTAEANKAFAHFA